MLSLELIPHIIAHRNCRELLFWSFNMLFTGELLMYLTVLDFSLNLLLLYGLTLLSYLGEWFFFCLNCFGLFILVCLDVTCFFGIYSAVFIASLRFFQNRFRLYFDLAFNFPLWIWHLFIRKFLFFTWMGIIRGLNLLFMN